MELRALEMETNKEKKERKERKKERKKAKRLTNEVLDNLVAKESH